MTQEVAYCKGCRIYLLAHGRNLNDDLIKFVEKISQVVLNVKDMGLFMGNVLSNPQGACAKAYRAEYLKNKQICEKAISDYSAYKQENGIIHNEDEQSAVLRKKLEKETSELGYDEIIDLLQPEDLPHIGGLPQHLVPVRIKGLHNPEQEKDKENPNKSTSILGVISIIALCILMIPIIAIAI